MTSELELKYAVRDIDGLQRWLEGHLPPRPGTGWNEVPVTDRYVDTYGGALAAAGYGARLRERGGTTTIGLKSDVAVRDAVHERSELEAPATPSLVPAEWPASEVRQLVQRVVGGEPLRERFVLRQVRREAEHHRPDSRLLISIDRVHVEHRGRPVGELQQLEVELLSGDPSALELVGRRIEASQLVHREARSKPAIAAALVAGRNVPGRR